MSDRPPAPPPPPRARRGLATQIALVTTLVAAIAVAITFAVSAKLVRDAAEQQGRAQLGHYAELIADGAAGAGATSPGERLRQSAASLRALHRVAQIVPVRVLPTGQVSLLAAQDTASSTVAANLPQDVTGPAAAGQPVDSTVHIGRRDYAVVGRPLASGNGSVVLVQPLASTAALTGTLRHRLVVALLIGLAVAILAGILLARRLARPLRHAADAARRITRGHRDIRLQPEGPREVAAVAESLNTLAAALGTSEQRQREFLLSVSHELRTPLTAVSGYAEALADGVVAPGEAAAVGTTMLGEARRLERLVSDLLDLARLGAADFRVDLSPVDLARLVRDAGAVWSARAAGRGVPVTVEAPGVAVPVTTDPTRVRQIVDGLAENALRVLPAGAPLVLAVRRRADGWAEVEVRDGGPGLTDDDIGVAFERSALHDRYRGVRRVGTGIGLALIAGLTARLGGSAEAGHAPEGGARFVVRLPPLPPP